MKRFVQLCLVLTFSFQLLAFSCFAAEKGLVAYWSFDEGSGDVAKDKSGNNLNGTLNNAVFEKGQAGTCLDFNGTDAFVEIEQSDKLNLDFNTPMTFMFWVNIADVSPQASRDILSKADLGSGNAQTGYRIYQYPDTRIWFQLANERQPGNNYLCAGPAKNIGGGWHHIAITYKGDNNANNINFYVDGKLVAKSIESNALSGSIQNEKPLMIGRMNDAASFLSGSLDELKIFNRVLTPDEILAESPKLKAAPEGELKAESSKLKVEDKKEAVKPVTSNEQPVTVSKGLIGWWSFDEGSGDVAKDKSSSRLDGANNNGVYEPGKAGTCLNFNGSDAYVEIEHSEKINFERNTPLSFSFWVKINDLNPEGSRDIISKIDFMGGNVQRGYRIYQDWQGSKIFLQLANERVPSDNYLLVGTPKDVGPGWHHICFTYKGDVNANNVILYMDGAPVAKSIGNNHLTDSIQNEKPLLIGKVVDAANFFNGCVDEVKIFDRVLTPEEVLVESLKLKAAPEGELKAESSKLKVEDKKEAVKPVTSNEKPVTASKGLIGWWPFDEGSGDVAKDKSGNKQDGKISGAVFEKGRVGTCLNFNGSDAFVEVEPSEKLNFEYNEPMTIFFWVNIKDEAPETAKEILSKIDVMGGNAQRGYRVFQYPGTTLNFQIAHDRQPGSDYMCVFSESDIGLGWHHITIVYKGDKNANKVDFYVDNKLTKKTVEASALTGDIKNDMPLVIGRFGQQGNPFNGLIDELKIYRGALTADEISADYVAGGGKVEPKKEAKMAGAKKDPENPFTGNPLWIWQPGDTDTEPRDKFFRAEMQVSKSVSKAYFQLSTGNDYYIYINGELAGEGRIINAVWVDNIEITKFLRPGKNTVAVKIHIVQGGPSSLLAEVSIGCKTGETQSFITDGSWKSGGAEEKNWEKADFNDSKWQKAAVTGTPPWTPWGEYPITGTPVVLADMSLDKIVCPKDVSLDQQFELGMAFTTSGRLRRELVVDIVLTQGSAKPIKLGQFKLTPSPTLWPVNAPVNIDPVSLEVSSFRFIKPGKYAIEVRLTNSANALATATLNVSEEKEAAATPLAADQIKKKGELVNYSSGEKHTWYTDKDGIFYLDHRPFITRGKNEGFIYNLEFYTNNKEGNLKAVELAESGALIDAVRVRLIDYVDCSSDTYAITENGVSHVEDLGLGRGFRVTDPRPVVDRMLPTFMYTMRTTSIPKPNIFIAELPNDMERHTTILLTENNGPVTMGWEYSITQVYTGREYPCDSTTYKHGLVFFPKSARTDVSVSGGFYEAKRLKKGGAAVSQMWMYEMLDPLKKMENNANIAKGYPERRVGMGFTHPPYLYQQYGYSPNVRPDTPSLEQQASMLNFAYYHKFVGLNHLEYNIIDGGDNSSTAYYKGCKFFNVAYNGAMVNDIMTVAESFGFTVIPSLTSFTVPIGDKKSKEKKMGFTDESYQMDRTGELKMGLNNKAFGMLVDPLRPEVQEAFLFILKEILDSSAKYKSVPAIGFRASGFLGINFVGCWGYGKGEDETCYSKWDVEQFEKDSGVKVEYPNNEFSPSSAYLWLKANAWEKWIDWRCKKMRDLWLRARDLVVSYRPDLKLYVKTDLPGEIPGKCVEWAVEKLSPTDCLRLAGYDPKLFWDEPGIYIQQSINQGADRTFRKWDMYKPNSDPCKTFNYDPRLKGVFRTKEGASTEVWFRYWEERLPKSDPSIHCAIPSPLKRNYYEPITYTIRNENVTYLSLFGWTRGTTGHTLDLRTFTRAFRALPAISPKDFDGKIEPAQDERLWVKWFADRLAVMNDSNKPRRVRLTIPRALDPGSKLVDLASNKVLVVGSAKTGREIQVDMDLDIFDLRTLLIVK